MGTTASAVDIYPFGGAVSRRLELNAQRAQEEALEGAREAAVAPPKKTRVKKPPLPPANRTFSAKAPENRLIRGFPVLYSLGSRI